MKNVLITRQKEQAHELESLLRSKGYETFIEPLFRIEKLPIKNDFSAQKISAVIVTSANACDAVINFGLPQDVKIFVVGKKTAQKLVENGFKNIFFAPKNNADSLRDLIVETHFDKDAPILYFHGSIVSLDFKKELEKRGFKVEKILAYKTHEKESFSADLLQFSRQNSFDQILLFSQNSAKIFFKLAQQHNLLEYFGTARILCLSEKILFEVRKFGFKNSATFDEISILKNFYD